MTDENMTNKKVLIIGIAGGLAQITARVILGENPDYKIYGVDNRTIPELTVKGLTCIKMKFSRGNFECLMFSFNMICRQLIPHNMGQ